jgi:hypothetical protein
MPLLPGVQIVYEGAFQLPAQANPLGAISSTPAGLAGSMAKLNAGLRAWFVLFTALALSCTMVPTCME